MILRTTIPAHHETVYRGLVPSPFGDLAILWRKKGRSCRVIAIRLPGEFMPAPDHQSGLVSAHIPPSLAGLAGQIRQYFTKVPPKTFSLDRLDLDCCYDFQWKVLMGVRHVPPGMTISYGKLADFIGAPRAARAVGTALARNPFPLVLPCHRVIRSSGTVGYFGGGSLMKENLLRLEGVLFEENGAVMTRCRRE